MTKNIGLSSEAQGPITHKGGVAELPVTLKLDVRVIESYKLKAEYMQRFSGKEISFEELISEDLAKLVSQVPQAEG